MHISDNYYYANNTIQYAYNYVMTINYDNSN